MLKVPEFRRIAKNDPMYPSVKIKCTSGSFKVTYSSDLENMFSIQEKSENIDKEISLYEDNTKQYFIDNFNMTKNIVDKILIKFDDSHKKVFYDKDTGIVWNHEDFYDCVKKLSGMKKSTKEYKKCIKVIEKHKDKIKLGPEGGVKLSQKVSSPKNTGDQGTQDTQGTQGAWECQTCLLENPSKNNRCMACGEPKN